MSYINDALRKVKKEKGSEYEFCSDTIFDEAQKPAGRPPLSPLIAVAVIILLVAVVSAAWWWPEVRKGRSPDNVQVVQVPPVAPAQPSAVVHEEARAVNQEAAAPHELPADAEPEMKPVLPAAGEALTLADVQVEKAEASAPETKNDQQPQLAPAHLKVTYEQALQAHREGKLAEAARLYRIVIKADPLHASAWNNLGVVRMSQKKYGMAAGNFQEALKIKSDYASAHYNLACLYARKGDKKQGLYYLKNAIAANPEARQWAQQDHDFDNLAGLPEFSKLVEAGDN